MVAGPGWPATDLRSTVRQRDTPLVAVVAGAVALLTLAATVAVVLVCVLGRARRGSGGDPAPAFD